jgi:hypothetical protein
MGRKARYLMAALLAVGAAQVAAIPPYESFVKGESGYDASCLLCHQPGARRLTAYAREYVRLGGGLAALNTLNNLDSDNDGAKTSEELKWHSNPGDARSTPDHAGPWLARKDSLFEPGVPLKTIFRRDVSLEVFNMRLTGNQIDGIERTVRQKLPNEGRYAVFYLVKSADKKTLLGYATYASFIDAAGRFNTLLVAARTDMALEGLLFLNLHADKRFLKQDYLDQYRGLSYKALDAVAAPPGQEEAGAQTLNAVRSAVKTMDAILSSLANK